MDPDLRIVEAVERGIPFEMFVDGKPIRAFPGETVAGALLAAAKYALRYTTSLGAPRGIFCGIGYCFDCRTTIDGIPNQRACMTLARPGCRILTQEGAGTATSQR